MEIIHLILGKANPERMNGVNKVVYQLATQQKLAGKNVAVWGVTRNPVHNYGERIFETRLFKLYRNPFKLDRNLKQALLGLGKNAIVHLHGGWVPVYASLSGFLIRQQIPYVFTPHGAYNTIAMKRNSLVKQVYFQLFERKLLDGTKQIHAIGESEVTGLNRFFPNSKTFLLPYGYQASSHEIIAAQPADQFTIGFIGRLDIHTKGLDILLEAFSRFHATEAGSRLWIVGDSNQRQQLVKMIAQKQLENSVVLWGSKFGDEKDQLLRQMHVFAHPSRNEGLPASVLEACHSGVAVVVSEATNIAANVREYHAGIVIADEDTTALANAFTSMHREWKQKRLQQFGTNGKKMVASAFHWKNIVNTFDQLYTNA